MGKQSKIKQALSMAVLAIATSTCDGFAVRTKRSRTDMTLYYRSEDPMTALHTEDLAANLVVNPLLGAPPKMPSWLRVERSHLMEKKMDELKDHMYASFYTESEVSKLVFAIEEASLGNRNVMAGATEFCLIIVDTMEMGLNALIAAAFHYCSCVKAREQSLFNKDLNVWEPKEHKGVRMFGNHAIEIARDAASLKKIEMVFSSIVQNTSMLNSRDANNLRNLLLTDSRDWRALAIRSAACLFRLRGLEASGNKRLTSEAVRASREALYIFAPLASRLGMHRLKNELEEAAFKTLYRRQYETVTSLADQMRYKKFESGVTRRSLVKIADSENGAMNIGESMKCVLESVKQDMEDVLSKDPVFSTSTESFYVSARVKEPYSLWKKMLRSRVNHVLQVPDALALRIVLNAKKLSNDEPDQITRARDRALCYYAQQICINNWAPLEGNPRFKDYVENPKPNGYQSLHYTASTEWQDEEWALEIQVRSGEMHKVAEYGLASHWDYKAKKKTASSSEISEEYSSNSYFRHVQEWHWQQRSGAAQWDAAPASEEADLVMNDVERDLRAKRIRKRNKELAPYLEALNAAQSDLAHNHVFVFLSQSSEEGNIIALPSGACVIDALKVGERSSGLDFDWRCTPSLNGDQTTFSQQLRNGDILTVPRKISPVKEESLKQEAMLTV